MDNIMDYVGPVGLPAILIVSMYLMLYLPQKKREKAVSVMQGSLKTGDDIITYGGIMGKIINMKDDVIVIESSIEKTQLKLKKWSIKEIVR